MISRKEVDGWCCYGCFVPSSKWVNILNVNVVAYPNWFNLINKNVHVRFGNKWVCFVDVNLLPPLKHPLSLNMTQWNIRLILSQKNEYIPHHPLLTDGTSKMWEWASFALIPHMLPPQWKLLRCRHEWVWMGRWAVCCGKGLLWELGFSQIGITAWGAACVQWTVLSTLG